LSTDLKIRLNCSKRTESGDAPGLALGLIWSQKRGGMRNRASKANTAQGENIMTSTTEETETTPDRFNRSTTFAATAKDASAFNSRVPIRDYRQEDAPDRHI
jgi:hypothetical protein